MASIEDVAECGARADALVRGALARVMRQARSVAAALAYVLALGRDTRANCWALAESAGHERPFRLQRLLCRMQWDWTELRAALPALASAVLPDPPGDILGPGLALDETAHLRKGGSAACVAAQHAGVTGKIENCVTWVFAALVTASGQCWADFDIYMPKAWASDPARRKRAGIPENLVFATKPDLALAQVRRIIASGIRICWAAADEVYGRCADFRAGLRALRLPYAVIVPCSQPVTLPGGVKIRADQAVPGLVFEERSAGDGEKGPRYADWALRGTADPCEHLLVRRLKSRDENEYTFYLCWAPEEVPGTMTYFITMASRRWPAETTFRTGKDAFGWDQCQARTWASMCRHTVLTALAQVRTAAARAALTGTAALPPPPEEPPVREIPPEERPLDPDDLLIYTGDAPVPAIAGQPCPAGIPPVLLSPAETTRLLDLARDWQDGRLPLARLAFHLRWSRWRRRHQARARWHHYSARLTA